ncbi:hypothetical protein SAMN05421773_103113 [Streptomyces aidingensis]|uniref:SCO6045-like C-terminal domain-containing protein n=1 Tax=Streptomyces aidingensis TaxID=910347 RepID=A0A1I1IVU6_9ACTN|nr:hypothetical protein SAMN05421773_103113 [Streptomyces aidingensis]
MDRPTVTGKRVPARDPAVEAARQRLAVAQTALLSALVTGTPAPEGFDRARLRAQRAALAAKRVSVLARVAPELPGLLGDTFRPRALAYVRSHPLTGGYRQDAARFTRHLLDEGPAGDRRTRRRLRHLLRGEG